MLKGIDVASWQGDIDFNLLKKAVDFIIIKSSEGVGFTDPKFIRNQTEARKAKMCVGYYHFARPDLGNLAENEAAWFLKTIGEIKDGEILCLDFEVGFNNVVGWCKKFLDYLSNKLSGYKPLIYLNQSQVKSYNWKPIIDANYGLWLARYDYDPEAEVPTLPWPILAIRQYSNKEVVKGISGGVDANVFYGDKEAFKKYGVIASPAPENAPTPALEVPETKIKELEEELSKMRLSRDTWKKVAKDRGDELSASVQMVEKLGQQVTYLQTVLGTNKTPLSEYSAKELASGLLKKIISK